METLLSLSFIKNKKQKTKNCVNKVVLYSEFCFHVLSSFHLLHYRLLFQFGFFPHLLSNYLLLIVTSLSHITFAFFA